MKVDQFRDVLAAAEQMHRENGDAATARALSEISDLLAERGTMTVAAFATLVAKVAADDSVPS